jgi:ribosomal-protein-alanine N-acetyltransferase
MRAEYVIRRAVGHDVESIVALDRATEYLPHWPAAEYEAALETQDAKGTAPVPGVRRCLFVAISAGSLVGFAVGKVMALPQEVSGELESVAVAGSARRAGIGRGLCESVLAWCRRQGATEVDLEVRSRSAGPIALYGRLGFLEVGRRAKYYRDPVDDAVLMRLPCASDQVYEATVDSRDL